MKFLLKPIIIINFLHTFSVLLHHLGNFDVQFIRGLEESTVTNKNESIFTHVHFNAFSLLPYCIFGFCEIFFENSRFFSAGRFYIDRPGLSVVRMFEAALAGHLE